MNSEKFSRLMSRIDEALDEALVKSEVRDFPGAGEKPSEIVKNDGDYKNYLKCGNVAQRSLNVLRGLCQSGIGLLKLDPTLAGAAQKADEDDALMRECNELAERRLDEIKKGALQFEKGNGTRH